MHLEFRSQGYLALKENDAVNSACLVLAIYYSTRQTRGIFSIILGAEGAYRDTICAYFLPFHDRLSKGCQGESVIALPAGYLRDQSE